MMLDENQHLRELWLKFVLASGPKFCDLTFKEWLDLVNKALSNENLGFLVKELLEHEVDANFAMRLEQAFEIMSVSAEGISTATSSNEHGPKIVIDLAKMQSPEKEKKSFKEVLMTMKDEEKEEKKEPPKMVYPPVINPNLQNILYNKKRIAENASGPRNTGSGGKVSKPKVLHKTSLEVHNSLAILANEQEEEEEENQKEEEQTEQSATSFIAQSTRKQKQKEKKLVAMKENEEDIELLMTLDFDFEVPCFDTSHLAKINPKSDPQWFLHRRAGHFPFDPIDLKQDEQTNQDEQNLIAIGQVTFKKVCRNLLVPQNPIGSDMLQMINERFDYITSTPHKHCRLRNFLKFHGIFSPQDWQQFENGDLQVDLICDLQDRQTKRASKKQTIKTANKNSKKTCFKTVGRIIKHKNMSITTVCKSCTSNSAVSIYECIANWKGQHLLNISSHKATTPVKCCICCKPSTQFIKVKTDKHSHPDFNKIKDVQLARTMLYDSIVNTQATTTVSEPDCISSTIDWEPRVAQNFQTEQNQQKIFFIDEDDLNDKVVSAMRKFIPDTPCRGFVENTSTCAYENVNDAFFNSCEEKFGFAVVKYCKFSRKFQFGQIKLLFHDFDQMEERHQNLLKHAPSFAIIGCQKTGDKIYMHPEGVCLIHNEPPRTRDQFKIGETCAGMGGMASQFQEHGFQHTFVGDKNNIWADLCDQNSRYVFSCHDIYSVETIIGCYLSLVNCFAAGIPCQAFSIMGDKRGMTEPRGTVIVPVLKLAYILGVKYLLLECTPKVHDDATFQTFINVACSYMDIKLKQGIRHLQDHWINTRSRWLCLACPVTACNCALCYPDLKIQHSLNTFLASMDAELCINDDSLYLSEEDIDFVQIDGVDIESKCLENFELAPCFLHSYQCQNKPCPCGCRMQPMNKDRLKKNMSTMIRKVQGKYRWLHEKEIAKLMGFSSSFYLGRNSGLAKVGLGQSVPPILTSVLIGSLEDTLLHQYGPCQDQHFFTPSTCRTYQAYTAGLPATLKKRGIIIFQHDGHVFTIEVRAHVKIIDAFQDRCNTNVNVRLLIRDGILIDHFAPCGLLFNEVIFVQKYGLTYFMPENWDEILRNRYFADLAEQFHDFETRLTNFLTQGKNDTVLKDMSLPWENRPHTRELDPLLTTRDLISFLNASFGVNSFWLVDNGKINNKRKCVDCHTLDIRCAALPGGGKEGKLPPDIPAILRYLKNGNWKIDRPREERQTVYFYFEWHKKTFHFHTHQSIRVADFLVFLARKFPEYDLTLTVQGKYLPRHRKLVDYTQDVIQVVQNRLPNIETPSTSSWQYPEQQTGSTKRWSSDEDYETSNKRSKEEPEEGNTVKEEKEPTEPADDFWPDSENTVRKFLTLSSYDDDEKVDFIFTNALCVEAFRQLQMSLVEEHTFYFTTIFTPLKSTMLRIPVAPDFTISELNNLLDTAIPGVGAAVLEVDGSIPEDNMYVRNIANFLQLVFDTSRTDLNTPDKLLIALEPLLDAPLCINFKVHTSSNICLSRSPDDQYQDPESDFSATDVEMEPNEYKPKADLLAEFIDFIKKTYHKVIKHKVLVKLPWTLKRHEICLPIFWDIDDMLRALSRIFPRVSQQVKNGKNKILPKHRIAVSEDVLLFYDVGLKGGMDPLMQKDSWMEWRKTKTNQQNDEPASSSNEKRPNYKQVTLQLAKLLEKHEVHIRHSQQHSKTIVQKLSLRKTHELLQNENAFDVLKESLSKMNFEIIPDKIKIKFHSKNLFSEEEFETMVQKLILPLKSMQQEGTGEDIEQIPFSSLKITAKGIAICSLSQALPFIKMKDPFSEQPLALLVVYQNEDVSEISKEDKVLACRIALKQDDTSVPSIFQCLLAQIGKIKVIRTVVNTTMHIPEKICRTMLTIGKDDVKEDWGGVKSNPIAYVYKVHPHLKEIIITNRLIHHKQEKHFSLVLVTTRNATLHTLLKLSGEHGIFASPKKEDSNEYDDSYVPIWLEDATLETAFAKAKLDDRTLGLVKRRFNGKATTYGIRTKIENFQELSQKILEQPAGTTYIPGVKKFTLYPLPEGTDAKDVIKIITDVQVFSNWKFKPLRPLGRYTWLISAESEPQQWTLQYPEGDLVFTVFRQRNTEGRSQSVQTNNISLNNLARRALSNPGMNSVEKKDFGNRLERLEKMMESIKEEQKDQKNTAQDNIKQLKQQFAKDLEKLDQKTTQSLEEVKKKIPDANAMVGQMKKSLMPEIEQLFVRFNGAPKSSEASDRTRPKRDRSRSEKRDKMEDGDPVTPSRRLTSQKTL